MTARYVQYRYWCNNDARYEYVWLHEEDGEPSGCLTNPAHTTDPDRFAAVRFNAWSEEDELMVDDVAGASLTDDVEGDVLVELNNIPEDLGVPYVP